MTTTKSTRPPKPRARYHHGDLRRALLEAAVSLIDEHGPDAFTLRETARLVGVNHAAVYRHFEDKRALLAAVSEQGFVALTSKLRDSVVGVKRSDVLERLRLIGLAYLDFGMDNPSHYRVMFGARLGDGVRFVSLTQASREASTVLHDEMKEGVRSGALRDASPRDLGVTFWTMAHGYTSLVLGRQIRARSKEAAREYFAALTAPILDGIAAHKRSRA